MHASLSLLTHALRTPGEKLTTPQPAVCDLHRHAFFFGRDPVYSIKKEEKKNATELKPQILVIYCFQ